MNYKIGDKVELKSGKIVTITHIDSCSFVFYFDMI